MKQADVRASLQPTHRRSRAAVVPGAADVWAIIPAIHFWPSVAVVHSAGPRDTSNGNYRRCGVTNTIGMAGIRASFQLPESSGVQQSESAYSSHQPIVDAVHPARCKGEVNARGLVPALLRATAPI